MKAVTVVSLFAAALLMISFVPQAVTIIRTRDTEGISLKMYVITVTGFVAWLTYGVLVKQWAIIGQNIICLGSVGVHPDDESCCRSARRRVVADALTPESLTDRT